jgi:hypothetical protein
MEPLEPEFREALKRAHPGLEDRDIDRYEELLAQRFLIEPEKAPQRIRELDREREQLLRERMPRYGEVWQRYNAKGPRGHSRPMR